PAASGKGTVARALARHYGLPHLDTGLLYRAVGLSVRRAGGDPDAPLDALAGCGFADALLADPEIRSEDAGAWASRVSAHPRVRAALMQRQRDFAGQKGGAVLDGRDIGTVIAPGADAKLYVTASVEVRAGRRHREMLSHGRAAELDALIADIRSRDDRDMNRAEAPLRQAEDAALLDTSNMTIDEAVRQAIALVDAQMEGRRHGGA
ncbi:MAG TPA: d(CMP) kinase, partial [Shinella sp.]|nr:d(CMP) kinase [Shinella sp.]